MSAKCFIDYNYHELLMHIDCGHLKHVLVLLALSYIFLIQKTAGRYITSIELLVYRIVCTGMQTFHIIRSVCSYNIYNFSSCSILQCVTDTVMPFFYSRLFIFLSLDLLQYFNSTYQHFHSFSFNFLSLLLLLISVSSTFSLLSRFVFSEMSSSAHKSSERLSYMSDDIQNAVQVLYLNLDRYLHEVVYPKLD